MTKELEKIQLHIKRRILEGIGEHSGILTNSPLLMLIAIPLLVTFILLFYGLYSGVLTDYQTTLNWCNGSWLRCAKTGSWWLPWWFIVRAGMIIPLFIWYWLMRWLFKTERWKAWWLFYAMYGYVFTFTVSAWFSSWLYILPIAWRGWISLLETVFLFGFLSRGYWVRTPIESVERLMKAMLPLASITGILGIIGVAFGRALSTSGSIAFSLFILGLFAFSLIVVPTAYYWGQKIWTTNPWFLEKKYHKNGESK
jgi:hypothetical protein